MRFEPLSEEVRYAIPTPMREGGYQVPGAKNLRMSWRRLRKREKEKNGEGRQGTIGSHPHRAKNRQRRATRKGIGGYGAKEQRRPLGKYYRREGHVIQDKPI